MSKITDIRTYLMGVAILSIMLFHTDKLFVVPKFMEFIQKTGYLGVDIFFFVSAYGLCYSMKKPMPIKQWYLRRLKRILPAFWVVSVFTGIMVHWSLYEHLSEVLLLGFLFSWIPQSQFNNITFWYIPAALLFYLLFPFIHRHRKVVTRCIVLIAIVSYVASCLLSVFFSSRELSSFIPCFLGRIPVFLLGMIIAEHEEKIREKMTFTSTVALVLVSLCAFVLLQCHAMGVTEILSFPCDDFFLMACSLPFIFFVCSLLQKYIKILNPFIHYCGRYSLEIYLLHVSFTWIAPRSELFSSFNPTYTFFGAFVLSLPCAFLLNKGLGKVIR